MKLNRLIFSIVVATLFVFTSCTQKFKSTPVAPVNVQVNVTMDDLEYVGEVTGTSTQSYLLGRIAIGGRRNHAGQVGGTIGLPQTRGVNNALYDALIFPPTNHLAKGGFHCKVSDQGLNQDKDFAQSFQNDT